MADVKNNMVHGTRAVLDALRRVEPQLYKTVVKDIKSTAQPLRDKVAEGFPDKPWNSSKPIQWTLYGRTKRGRSTTPPKFPKYNGKKARRSVTVQVGGRKVRRTNSYPVLRLRQADAGAMIYDLAKNNVTEGKEQFVKNLNRTGKPSRVMWKRTKHYLPLVERKLDKIVSDIEKKFTADIAAETHRRNQASLRGYESAMKKIAKTGKVI